MEDMTRGFGGRQDKIGAPQIDPRRSRSMGSHALQSIPEEFLEIGGDGYRAIAHLWRPSMIELPIGANRSVAWR